MAQFSIENFMPPLSDGRGLSIFDARYRNIRRLPEQQRVTVDSAHAHNLPTLAEKYLQDVSLWWVLLMYNGLQDPIEEIVPGLILRIPNRNELILMLESQQAESSVVRI